MGGVGFRVMAARRSGPGAMTASAPWSEDMQAFDTVQIRGHRLSQKGARRERGLAAAAAGGALPQVEQAGARGDQPAGVPVAARQALKRRRVRHRSHRVAAVVARVRAPARAPAPPQRRRHRRAPAGRTKAQASGANGAGRAAAAAACGCPASVRRQATPGRCQQQGVAGWGAAARRSRLWTCLRHAAPLRVERMSMAGSAARPLSRPCAHTATAARPACSRPPGTRYMPSHNSMRGHAAAGVSAHGCAPARRGSQAAGLADRRRCRQSGLLLRRRRRRGRPLRPLRRLHRQLRGLARARVHLGECCSGPTGRQLGQASSRFGHAAHDIPHSAPLAIHCPSTLKWLETPRPDPTLEESCSNLVHTIQGGSSWRSGAAQLSWPA